MSTSPPGPVAAPTLNALEAAEAARGAWGGAWSVLYGCLVLLKSLASVAFLDLTLHGTRLAAATIRTQAAGEETADLARRLADVLARTPEALGAEQRPWLLATAGLAALIVAAGVGVIRRSEVSRGATIGLLVLAALGSVALTVHAAVSVLPRMEAWMKDFATIVEELERQGARGQTGSLKAMLRANGTQSLVWEIALQTLHLGVVALLLVRVAGSKTRVWCAQRR